MIVTVWPALPIDTESRYRECSCRKGRRVRECRRSAGWLRTGCCATSHLVVCPLIGGGMGKDRDRWPQPWAMRSYLTPGHVTVCAEVIRALVWSVLRGCGGRRC